MAKRFRSGQLERLWKAAANVTGLELYTVFSLPHISQIYMFFLGELNKPEFSSGEESLKSNYSAKMRFRRTHYLFQLLLRLEFFFEDRKKVISQSDISTCYSSLGLTWLCAGVSERHDKGHLLLARHSEKHSDKHEKLVQGGAS